MGIIQPKVNSEGGNLTPNTFKQDFMMTTIYVAIGVIVYDVFVVMVGRFCGLSNSDDDVL